MEKALDENQSRDQAGLKKVTGQLIIFKQSINWQKNVMNWIKRAFCIDYEKAFNSIAHELDEAVADKACLLEWPNLASPKMCSGDDGCVESHVHQPCDRQHQVQWQQGCEDWGTFSMLLLQLFPRGDFTHRHARTHTHTQTHTST